MADIRLERTFWPVGHGAFYTEHFYNRENDCTFTAVYDCGGKGALRKKKNTPAQSSLFMQDKVNEFIGSIFYGDAPKVDLLFISHLHRDHINGVPDLLPYVKRLVLPQLEEEAYVEAFMYNAITSGNNVLDVDSNIQSFIVSLASDDRGIDTRITRVRPSNNDNPNLDHPEEVTSEQLGSVIDSGTPIHVPPTLYHNGKPFWIYIPVNLPIKTDKKESLSDVLCSKLGANLKGANGKIIWSNLQDALRQADIAEIKKIYEDYFDIKYYDHNFYSMPVFSGPVIGAPHHWYIDETNMFDEWYNDFHWRRFRWHIPHHNQKLLSCLYMGDFEAKKQDNMATLVAELKDYYYRAGIQQVPHHYSWYNHNEHLYEHRILAFGNVDDNKDDSYSHRVFRDILFSMFLPPLVITENDEQKTIEYKMYF